MSKRGPNARTSSVRNATQAIHKVLAENGYHNDYVLCGGVARDIYGDTSIPPFSVEVLFLKPTHTLSLKQLIPTFNSQNFFYTREGEKLYWRSQPGASGSGSDPFIEILLTPPTSSYTTAEKQIMEGYPLVPYPYLILRALWQWSQAREASTQQAAARDILWMLAFLDSRPSLQKPFFFDRILRNVCTPLVDRFYREYPRNEDVWKGLGFSIRHGQGQAQQFMPPPANVANVHPNAPGALPQAAPTAPTPRSSNPRNGKDRQQQQQQQQQRQQQQPNKPNANGPHTGHGRGARAGVAPSPASSAPSTKPSTPNGHVPKALPAAAGTQAVNGPQSPRTVPHRFNPPSTSSAPQAATNAGANGATNNQNAKNANAGRKGRLTRYEIRYQAAQTTIGILQGFGYTCALFGSMACKLYGNKRSPNDIDLLVIPPPDPDAASLTPEEQLLRAQAKQEELKALLAENCPPDSHYVRLKSKDPTATYKVLYWLPQPKPEGKEGEEELEVKEAEDVEKDEADVATPPGEDEVQGDDEEVEDAVGEELAEAVGKLAVNGEAEGEKAAGVVGEKAEGAEATAEKEGASEGKETAKDQKSKKKSKKPNPNSRPSPFRSTKVDILTPGIMSLPSLPPKLVVYRGRLPCVPYPVLLAQKLQGWSDHLESTEERFQKKVPEDVKDLEWLLGSETRARNWRSGNWVWKDRWMFSEEFEAATRERVKRICAEHPNMKEGWSGVGLDVE